MADGLTRSRVSERGGSRNDAWKTLVHNRFAGFGLRHGGRLSNGSAHKPIVTTEPGLAGPVDSDATVIAADGTRQVAPAKTVTWVDRHPLFSKPRDYWNTSGDNKIVKAAAATFVGVPAGMYNEAKQIIVGVPQEQRY